MNMRTPEDIHREAELVRYSAEERCNEYNTHAEEVAIAQFAKTETAKFFREEADFAIGVVVRSLGRLRKRDMPRSFAAGAPDLLVRLLSDPTRPSYDTMTFDRKLPDEETIKAWESEKLLSDSFDLARTPASRQQTDLREAFLEYAQVAAAYAKRIHSASLLEWAQMIDILSLNSDENFTFDDRIDDAAARRAVELEQSAAERLRLDRIIDELPPSEL